MAETRSSQRLIAIVQAATKVFGEVGYDGAQMTAIAAAAGVSIGTLYNYVEGKDALFLLVAEHAVGEPIEDRSLPVASRDRASLIAVLEQRISKRARIGTLDRALAATTPGGGAAELESIVGEIYDLIASTRDGADALERSAREAPDLAELFYRNVRGRLISDLASYSARTPLASTVDPQAIARFVIETVTWFARHRHRDPVPLPMSEGAARLAAIECVSRALRATNQSLRDSSVYAPRS